MSPKLRGINKPSRMWIDGKCFNIKKYRNSPNDKQLVQETDTSQEPDGFDIIPGEDGKLFTSFRLPIFYNRQIKTHPHFTLNALEKETSTKISTPKFGKDENITITGDDIFKVAEARHRIHSVVDQIRHSHSVIQFISIPVLSDEIKENFIKFKNEILSDTEPVNGMDESIFQSPLKLHLTIAVFALMDDIEKEVAIQALNEYKTTILDPLMVKMGPLKIVVSGINCMENNYKNVNVLYANAKISNETEKVSFQKIANELSDYFYEKGLLVQYKENVKLHVTLINTKYRKTADDTTIKKKKWPKRIPFDARKIMEKYKDYHFGECDFDSVHLSLISSKGEDGFYKPLYIIKANHQIVNDVNMDK